MEGSSRIQHPHQGGADLGGQPDALTFAAGQCARAAAQRQVFQPHRVQKAKPGTDLLEDLIGNALLLFGEGQVLHELQRLSDRQLAEVVDGQAAHRDGQHFRAQSFSAAGGAGAVAHAILQLPAHAVGLGLLITALQIADNAFKGLLDD